MKCIQRLLGAPEKYIGLWMGTIANVFAYFICTFCYEYNGTNVLELRGLDSLAEDRTLFWISFGVNLFLVFVHIRVIWTHTDPGIVSTRETDFEEVAYMLVD
jgi:hypothetical protein